MPRAYPYSKDPLCARTHILKNKWGLYYKILTLVQYLWAMPRVESVLGLALTFSKTLGHIQYNFHPNTIFVGNVNSLPLESGVPLCACTHVLKNKWGLYY